MRYFATKPVLENYEIIMEFWFGDQVLKSLINYKYHYKKESLYCLKIDK